MATIVLSNASIVINSVDLSDHDNEVKITYGSKGLEDTAMGATFETTKSGLKNLKMEFKFFQDYASSKVDATLFSLVGGSGVTIVVMANASSGTNNTYTATNMRLDGDYSPIDGKVGDLVETSVAFTPASGCTFART